MLFYFVISISQVRRCVKGARGASDSLGGCDETIAQVFLNKQIVSRLRCSDGSDFPFSVTVTAYQLLVALALCGFLPKGSLPSRWVGPRRASSRGAAFSDRLACRLQLSVLWKLLPLSLAWLFMLAFGNLCLLYVQVTGLQVVSGSCRCCVECAVRANRSHFTRQLDLWGFHAQFFLLT